MFTKIIFLAFVAVVSCSDHHYALKHQKEPHKQYRHPYEHQIQVHEPSSEEYKPESHGHAYSSQSVLHQGQAAAYEGSHETTEHVAPVYQYVDEQSEENVHSALVQHKYRPVYAPQHEVQTIRVPAHHKVAAYYRPSHEAHKSQAYYQPESQEVQTPHKVHYQSNEAYHHGAPEHHGIQEQVTVPVHAESHESHDEPIDYYAYPKYQYEYKVEDPHTGDNKFQHEIRDGDVVKGVYGLHEADGSFRTVEYSSDKHHGFNAIVKHSVPGQHVHIESHHQNAEDHHKN